MKVPLLGIGGMVFAARFRGGGGFDHVSKFQIENRIEIQFQMSIELLIHMQPVPHCRAGTQARQARNCTSGESVRPYSPGLTVQCGRNIHRQEFSPMHVAVKYVSYPGAILPGRY